MLGSIGVLSGRKARERREDEWKERERNRGNEGIRIYKKGRGAEETIRRSKKNVGKFSKSCSFINNKDPGPLCDNLFHSIPSQLLWVSSLVSYSFLLFRSLHSWEVQTSQPLHILGVKGARILCLLSLPMSHNGLASPMSHSSLLCHLPP